jgi:hypothetical protein
MDWNHKEWCVYKYDEKPENFKRKPINEVLHDKKGTIWVAMQENELHN